MSAGLELVEDVYPRVLIWVRHRNGLRRRVSRPLRVSDAREE